jgi:hypothetical protein
MNSSRVLPTKHCTSDVFSISTVVDLGIFHSVQANGESKRELKIHEDDFIFV